MNFKRGATMRAMRNLVETNQAFIGKITRENELMAAVLAAIRSRLFEAEQAIARC
jgi:hypothetical protein